MDVLMWITITVLLLATLAWVLFVRHLGHMRSKAFESSLRDLNASLDLEVQTLSRLDRSLVEWTATMEQAAAKLQERGQRPSPAPANQAAAPSISEHPVGFDEPTRIGQAMRWDFGEGLGKSWGLIHRWNRDLLYTELKSRLKRTYILGYPSRHAGHSIEVHFLQSDAPGVSLKAIKVLHAGHHYGGDNAPDFDPVSSTVKLNGMDLEVMCTSARAGEMDWVMATARSVLRMHGAAGTGKVPWRVGLYYFDKNPSRKVGDSAPSEAFSLQAH
jgi:hypothetical protein